MIKTKEEIQKRYETYYNKWRDYDLLTSLLSILSLVVAIIDVITDSAYTCLARVLSGDLQV